MVVARLGSSLHSTELTTTIMALTCRLYEVRLDHTGVFEIFGGTTEIMKEIIGRSLGV
jgi:hypothetical protein